jgi:hypothetical protein
VQLAVTKVVLVALHSLNAKVRHHAPLLPLVSKIGLQLQTIVVFIDMTSFGCSADHDIGADVIHRLSLEFGES